MNPKISQNDLLPSRRTPTNRGHGSINNNTSDAGLTSIYCDYWQFQLGGSFRSENKFFQTWGRSLVLIQSTSSLSLSPFSLLSNQVRYIRVPDTENWTEILRELIFLICRSTREGSNSTERADRVHLLGNAILILGLKDVSFYRLSLSSSSSSSSSSSLSFPLASLDPYVTL